MGHEFLNGYIYDLDSCGDVTKSNNFIFFFFEEIFFDENQCWRLKEKKKKRNFEVVKNIAKARGTADTKITLESCIKKKCEEENDTKKKPSE